MNTEIKRIRAEEKSNTNEKIDIKIPDSSEKKEIPKNKPSIGHEISTEFPYKNKIP